MLTRNAILMVFLRRAAALLLVFGGVMAIWFGVVAPVRPMTSSQDRWRLEVRTELGRARSEAAMVLVIQRRLKEIPQAPVRQEFYGESAGVGSDAGPGADTALRDDVSRLAQTSGATVQSLLALPTVNEGRLRTHGLRLTLSMTVDQLRGFIAGVRAHPRYLRIERLSVSAPQSQSPDKNPPLLVKLEIFGYASGSHL